MDPKNPVFVFTDPYVFPAGSNFIIPIVLLHRDPEVWPEPEKFDPDRFLPDEAAKRHRCSYIPFSFGVRNCIGLYLATMVFFLTFGVFRSEIWNDVNESNDCHDSEKLQSTDYWYKILEGYRLRFLDHAEAKMYWFIFRKKKILKAAVFLKLVGLFN